MHLSLLAFSECAFIGCDFSMAKILNVSFREVKFQDCKLLVVDFSKYNVFFVLIFI